jgi:hypothetical protein
VPDLHKNALHNTACQRLARPAAGPHPDPDVLTAFAEGGLRSTERDQVLAHLSACCDCREVVMLAQPEEAEVLAAAELAPARTWSSWYRLRWGAVAASLVIVAAAVFIYRQQNGTFERNVAQKSPTVSEEKVATKEQPPAATLAEPTAPARVTKHAAPTVPAKKDEVALAQAKPKQLPPAAPPATDSVVGGVVAANKPNTGGGNALGNVTGATVAHTGPGYAGNITPPPPPATTAEVNSQTTVIQTQTTDVAAAKTARRAERDKLTATTTNEAAPVLGGPTTDANLARMRPAEPHWQWRVNNAGVVERSTDAKHWQSVPPSGAHFNAVVSSGSEVWDGAHWNKVTLSSTADVQGLTLTAPNHVLVTTSEGTQPVSAPQR